MGVISFFQRTKRLLWGLFNLLAGIVGPKGIIEMDPTMGDPPAVYIAWGLGAALILYGLFNVIKAFRRNGDMDIEKESRKTKRQKDSMNNGSELAPQKVNRVYRMKYNGTGEAGPAYIDVPSYNAGSNSRPTRDEIIAALENMGYDKAKAKSLANGGSDRTWEVVG